VQGLTTVELKGLESEIEWVGTYCLLVRRIYLLVAEVCEQKQSIDRELAPAASDHHLSHFDGNGLKIAVLRRDLRLARASEHARE
jgi:hypothetical protein